MNVGTHIDDSCVTEFNSLKIGHQHRFVVYKLDDKTNTIVVDVIGKRDATYAEFLTHISANEARYAVFDFQAQTDEVPPRTIEKIIFIFWSPDTQPVKQKMGYAAGKEALKKKLAGIAKELQANELNELDETEIVKLVLH